MPESYQQHAFLESYSQQVFFPGDQIVVHGTKKSSSSTTDLVVEDFLIEDETSIVAVDFPCPNLKQAYYAHNNIATGEHIQVIIFCIF